MGCLAAEIRRAAVGQPVTYDYLRKRLPCKKWVWHNPHSWRSFDLTWEVPKTLILDISGKGVSIGLKFRSMKELQKDCHAVESDVASFNRKNVTKGSMKTFRNSQRLQP
jgi:hypothetical protein